MNIILIDHKAIWPSRHEYHVLTYAEEGFSPLNMHTENSELRTEDLKGFANNSNDLDQIITIYPKYSLSMIPRRFIRKPCSSIELYSKLLEFFELNALKIKAKKFIFDFRTHELQKHILDSIYMLKSNKMLSSIEEIVIIAC